MKKHRKHKKLTQTFKYYFGDDGFEKGIDRVEEKILIELVLFLGLTPESYSKDYLVKFLRKTYAQDVHTHEHIADFFKIYKTQYILTKSRPQHQDIVQKVESMLCEYELEASEYQDLYDYFITQKVSKVTHNKIDTKLKYLRLSNKKSKLQEMLDGVFDYEDKLEFNASLKYSLLGEEFSKIQPLKTKTFDIKNELDISIDELYTEVNELKQNAIKEAQERLNTFLLKQENNIYIEPQDIVKILKRSKPSNKFLSVEIDEESLKAIFRDYFNVENIEIIGEDIVIKSTQNYTVEEYVKNFNYTLEAHVSLDEIQNIIWNSKDFNLLELLHVESKRVEKEFNEQFELIYVEALSASRRLNLTEREIKDRLYDLIAKWLKNSLSINHKMVRKVVRAYNFSIQGELFKRQTQELLSLTIRDFKNLFPQARAMKRELVLHIGPTNSGKTYSAMQDLKKADTGYYLAPLRLLALEGYEELKSSDVDVSLITGEEHIINEDATHVSSTIEMLNYEIDVDVCVIDEVQMLDDRDRGWAWANAIIGAPASKVIMTGSANSKEAIEQLAEYLGEKLTVIEFERKTALEMLDYAIPLNHIQKGSAVIAFSRKDVLNYKRLLAPTYTVSVIYGNLSPEVRREEARRFRDGESEILVATDAIAMGLNLPIKTIIFSRAFKFDGISDRELTPSEVHQISGRAGRFGLNERGFISALDEDTLHVVDALVKSDDKIIKIPFNVSANLDHILLVGKILNENSLEVILKFFVDNMRFVGPFRAVSLESMLEASQIIDKYELDLSTKYHLACAPLTLKSPYIMATFEIYLKRLQAKRKIRYNAPSLEYAAQTTQELLRAEDYIKEISMYLWLSYRFNEFFVDINLALQTRAKVNQFLEESLKQDHFMSKCRSCSKTLRRDYKFKICQECFEKNRARNYRKK
ncbi:MAG: helicase-related protein [Campylobacterota bacterium]|nr:helicase-related protein [Campylobacterota bacterium]